MAKKQLNIRASNLTFYQIEQLSKWWGVTQTEVLTLVIDRIYREEKKAGVFVLEKKEKGFLDD